MVEVEAEAFFYTQTDRLPEEKWRQLPRHWPGSTLRLFLKRWLVVVVKVRTLEQKLVNGEPKVLVDLLANALAEILMQRLGYTLAEVQAKLLMDKLRDRIAREVETFYNTVGEVEGELMANEAPRIAVLRVKALRHKLTKF